MSDKKEYIERGALLKEAESRLVWNHQAAGAAVYEAIQEAPAADVAEVVRCEKCVHFRRTSSYGERTIDGCMRLGYSPCKPDDYCSYGERKDSADNG